MAFDFNFLSNTGGTSPAPIIYTYYTADIKASLVATGYFNEAYTRFNVNDIIVVVDTTVYTLRVTAVSKKSVTVVITFLGQKEHTEYHIPPGSLPAAPLSLNDDGVTFTPIPNMDIESASLFTASGGVLTYQGAGSTFLFNGTSDLECNKTAEITYSLVLNGTPVTDEQTKADFSSANSKSNISITGFVVLAFGDTLEVYAKSDGTVGTTITINKLDTTFLEV